MDHANPYIVLEFFLIAKKKKREELRVFLRGNLFHKKVMGVKAHGLYS